LRHAPIARPFRRNVLTLKGVSASQIERDKNLSFPLSARMTSQFTATAVFVVSGENRLLLSSFPTWSQSHVRIRKYLRGASCIESRVVGGYGPNGAIGR